MAGNNKFYGVYRGVVVDNKDPLKKSRLKLRIPQVLGNTVTEWAWASYSPGTTNVVVAIGDSVWAMFEGGDPSFPMWLGTTSNEVPVTPTEVPFSVAGGTSGTQPTFTGAPLFTGSYVRNGSQVHFQIQVDMDNITGFGTGQYYVELPFTSKYGYKFRDGCLHDTSTGREYAIGGHVAAGSKVLQLFSTDTQSSKVFDIAFTYNDPVTLATADNFHIAGTYIAG